MSQILVYFPTIFGNPYFTVLSGPKSSRIDVYVYPWQSQNGSIFIGATFNPLAWRIFAIDAVVIPFPNPEITPPVMKI